MSFTKTLSKQLWVGGASTYNITDFYFLKNAHVKVYVYTSGVPSLKTEGVDYNLTGAGNPSGGQITWIGTAPTALQQVLAQPVRRVRSPASLIGSKVGTLADHGAACRPPTSDRGAADRAPSPP